MTPIKRWTWWCRCLQYTSISNVSLVPFHKFKLWLKTLLELVLCAFCSVLRKLTAKKYELSVLKRKLNWISFCLFQPKKLKHLRCSIREMKWSRRQESDWNTFLPPVTYIDKNCFVAVALLDISVVSINAFIRVDWIGCKWDKFQTATSLRTITKLLRDRSTRIYWICLSSQWNIKKRIFFNMMSMFYIIVCVLCS